MGRTDTAPLSGLPVSAAVCVSCVHVCARTSVLVLPCICALLLWAGVCGCHPIYKAHLCTRVLTVWLTEGPVKLGGQVSVYFRVLFFFSWGGGWSCVGGLGSHMIVPLKHIFLPGVQGGAAACV